MSTGPPAPDAGGGHSTVKRALAAIDRLQARLDVAERTRTEPIAIVGLACRLPGGVESPDAFWSLLSGEVDAITVVPPERWDIERYFDPDPNAPGTMYSRHGGFLRDVDRFDSWFFRISPREAQSMDPQQRLLLEVAWEALESAGIAADRLRGSPTGVFVGLTTSDYAQLLMQERGTQGLDAFFFTGNPANAAPGRLAYTLGLQGPALALDTACSSSLVAVHQACASLRNGECSHALAGGVNLVLNPENTVAVCRTHALSPGGRCRTFDRAADGFVRSEGCGLVVLRRLSDAMADGDPIRAVIRGSAVNQDGASSGFTVPNGAAQQAVIRQALGALPAASIDYLEAHGTGTALGDPIEVNAASAVYGRDRDAARPLYIGSVKTNIGHCEAAAGIAALIKTVLALEHEEIPAHLHLRDANPHIPWATLPVRVPHQRTRWPRGTQPRRAGVSAFGASGTNAHVVLEEAPAAAPRQARADRGLHVLALSAKGRDALHDIVVRYRDYLAADLDVDFADVCHSAAVGRVHHRERVALVAGSAREAVAKLSAIASRLAAPPDASDVGEAPGAARVAFLFTGQGSQYARMGRALSATHPVFRDALDRCASILGPLTRASLLEVLAADDGRLDETEHTQPAIVAIEHALTVLLDSWGIHPAVVMGHSVGEYAAAIAAGVCSVEDGLRLVAERGRLMGSLPPGGTMASLAIDEARVREAVGQLGATVSIAAINAPQRVVVSGAASEVARIGDHMRTAGVRVAPLTVSHAFHSDLMDPMLDRYEDVARAVSFAGPSLPLVSNLTGRPMEGPPDAAYWRRHCRDPVRFADGVDALVSLGCDCLVEIGPQPTLVRLAAQCRPDAGFLGLATLSPGEGEERGLLETVAALYVRGVNPDWRAFDHGRARRHVPLPTYPFRRESHWIPNRRGPMPNHLDPTGATLHPPQRREAVLGRLRAHIAQLLRAPVSAIDVHLPFLEMGADSLVMVDAIGLIEKEFGLKVAIRRFFEDLSTIDALATYIDASGPAEAVGDADARVTAAAGLPASSTAPAGSPMELSLAPAVAGAAAPPATTALERILADQTRLMTLFMSQQAEAIRLALGGGTMNVAAPPAVVPDLPAAVVPRPESTAAAKTSDAAATVVPPMPWGTAAETRKRGLSDAQARHLDALIARYNARTPQSKALTQRYRSVLADSRATVGFRLSTKEMLYPIWGARSAGSRTWDVDGNGYIDFTMGFGVHLLGHQPDFVRRAVQEQFDCAVELGARSPLVGEVATLFTELTGLERAAFCNSGTEAVMAAVRLARAKTGRDKIVIFTNAYHGHADTTLARAQNVGGRLASVPMAPGVPGAVAGDVVVLDYDSAESLEIIRRRRHEIAAVMVEPVQSRHPKVQPRAFLQELRTLTREAGAALIFDEMITGFRAHLGGAQAYFGVRADLATYGKVVGGGLPIGVVAGSAEFMDGIDGGMWQYGDGSFPAADRTAFGGTFCQHPLSMAAAAAVLRHLKAEGPSLQQQLNERTDRLVRSLNDHFTAEEFPIEATHFSSLFRFEFSTNLDLLFYHMLEKGIYIWEWRSCFLATAHTEEDVRRFVDVVKESLDDLRHAGFAQRPPRPATAATEVPLSEAQRQLLTLLQIEKTASTAYNIGTTLELRGGLDVDRLGVALQRVVDRHSALRSTVTADGTHQSVHATSHVSLPVSDISAGSEEDRERALERWRHEISRQPIDLVRGPVFQPRLARLDEDRHILVLTAHHVFADGITMARLVDEMASFYNEPSLAAADVPMQFGEYIALCEAGRDSPEMKAHEAFWLGEFADQVPQLQLPLDRPRPPAKTYGGGRVTREIDRDTMASLRRVSRAHGCTLNMTLLAAFALLLHRYAGQDDIVVGTSVAGRPFAGSMEVAGYCTHLVPVRSRLEGDPTFTDVLAATRRRLLDVFDHQDLPFSRLLQILPAERSAGAFPLVSAVFNLEPASALPALAGLVPRLLPHTVSFTPFDLFVNVTDLGETALVDTDFNADLFDATTVERMMGCYGTLLRSVGETPSGKARELALLTPAERTQLAVTWNDTATVYPSLGWVHTQFERTAAGQPGEIAVAFEAQEVTRASLNARANRLARWLRSKGIGRDVLVGICCERSVELVTAILAVLKAGGAYVPIDPDYPADRVAFMLKDAAAPIVLTQDRWTGLLQSHEGELFRLDADWDRIASLDSTDPDYDVGGDDLAYVIYTSGSTGRPKGAMNTHRGLANRLAWMQDAYGLRGDDRVLQKTPFSFDVSVWEFLWPLVAGARLVLAEPGGHRDARYLVDVIERAHITTIHFVPSMLQVWLDEPDLARCASLRRVICSGEALPAALLRRYAATLDAPLHNLYGPTEASIDVTAWACDPALVRTTVPIGRPIANTQIYLLDARMQVVPIGVAGELFIGGIGVGRGYLNRPDLTERAFVPDPFSAEAGARLYRTGDLARYRDDGNIEYLGRTDQQVKIRGFRIELGEIEAALLECPGVSAAVVVLGDASEGRTRLVAYVAATERGGAFAADLGARLGRTLPEYMVPSAFVTVDAIPLLPNGKIDRHRLPPLEDVAARVTAAPGVETAVAAIWEEVLGQSPIGATDDFFALGGNSLSAGQVVSRISRLLNTAIGIKAIFLHPTVRALAAEVVRSNVPDLPDITALPPQADYELSPVQRRFWVQDQLSTGARGNCQPACFLVEGALDAGALRRAFHALVARHEILRTVFVEVDGRPRQRVVSAAESGFEFVEAASADGVDLETTLRRVTRRHAASRMNLGAGPLVRVELIALGSERHVCVCSMHHAVTDGWSVGVLLGEVAALYDAFVQGHDDPLPPLAIQYRDYAAWQNRILDGPESDAMRAYWRAKLAGGTPSLSLPSDEPRTGSYVRAVHRFVVDRALAERLDAWAHGHGATLYMAMLSGIKALLYRYTAQEDICVGTPAAGRVRPELENQIGPYLNVLPIRDTVRGGDTFASVLQATRRSTLDAFANQLYPYDRFAEVPNAKRAVRPGPLFDVGFTLQNQREVQRQPDSRYLRITEQVRDDESFADPEAETDVWFIAGRDEGGVAVEAVYNAALFRPATVDALSRDLLTLLAAAAATPDSTVAAVPLTANDSAHLRRRITVDLGL